MSIDVGLINKHRYKFGYKVDLFILKYKTQIGKITEATYVKYNILSEEDTLMRSVTYSSNESATL